MSIFRTLSTWNQNLQLHIRRLRIIPEYAKASLKRNDSSDGEYPDQQRNRNDTKRRDRKTSGSAGACKKFQSGHKISARNIQRPDSDQHYESIHPYAATCIKSRKPFLFRFRRWEILKRQNYAKNGLPKFATRHSAQTGKFRKPNA